MGKNNRFRNVYGLLSKFKKIPLMFHIKIHVFSFTCAYKHRLKAGTDMGSNKTLKVFLVHCHPDSKLRDTPKQILYVP